MRGSIDLDNGSIDEFIVGKRLYELDEIEKMVIENGFDNVQAYGDWDGQAFSKNSPKILLIAKKK